ncbi:uncharacterized protein LOC110829130 isoform X2 [Zootermopsis nevadensis]|uniref:uncharacterized protein LOC110829130 isoform X2 n=1 Tax=Zootermopsis nevadensis TaxID=136037 RepID=UPI000B8E78C3|nr:uncharacterized protein LOC110829130 isoform X2 [Zootermopsis nevadensis]
MAEGGYGGPKVTIFDSQGTLLNESTCEKAFGDLSLKYIIDSLRIVQQETNEFLTKLVHEQTSQGISKLESIGVEEDSKGDEDNEESNEVLPTPRCGLSSSVVVNETLREEN